MDCRKAGLLLKQLWDLSADGKYVCLGWIPGQLAQDRNLRKANWHQEMIKWTKGTEIPRKLTIFLEEHQDDELYFSPLAYDKPHRQASTVASKQYVLYADLDNVDPKVMKEVTPPWFHWETSPGHGQAMWRVSSGLGIEEYEPGGLNHRLTHKLGADKSGWDVTQMLRVPYSSHHKQLPPHEGRLISRDTITAPREVLESQLAVIPREQLFTVSREQLRPSELSVRECMMKVPARVRPGFRRRLNDRDEMDSIKSGYDNRSEARFTLEGDLLAAGVEPSVVAKLVINSPWAEGTKPSTILYEVAKKARERAVRVENEKRLSVGMSNKSWHSMAGVTPEEFDQFWQSRENLSTIRQLAASRMVSPWALLGVCMARAIASVPPYVVLPPTVASEASINFFVALAASSGIGKSAAVDVAKLLVGDNFHTHGVSTGEGLIQHYLRPVKQEDGSVKQELIPSPKMLLEIDEIDNLANVAGRAGQTTLETMRTAWSGGMMANGNASADRRRKVDAHTYRMALVAGVQPSRAGVLTNGASVAAGTLQRFLWMPAEWVEFVEVEEPDVESLELSGDEWSGMIVEGRVRIALPAKLEAAIKKHHRDRLMSRTPDSAAENIDNIDSHAVLLREKVSVALMLMDGRTEVTLDDWRLAGMIMKVSNRTRNWVFSVIAETTQNELHEKGAQLREVDEAKKKTPEERIAGIVSRQVAHSPNNEILWSKAYRRIPHHLREHLSGSLGVLSEMYSVEVITRGRARYFVGNG